MDGPTRESLVSRSRAEARRCRKAASVAVDASPLAGCMYVYISHGRRGGERMGAGC